MDDIKISSDTFSKHVEHCELLCEAAQACGFEFKLTKGQFNQPFFVTNCDIIIKADYVNLYEFHRKGGYDITLVASANEYVIPYGTCELNDDGHLSHINEKPK